eukprot:9342181-Heterocapsa_arctica.AAC.1
MYLKGTFYKCEPGPNDVAFLIDPKDTAITTNTLPLCFDTNWADQSYTGATSLVMWDQATRSLSTEPACTAGSVAWERVTEDTLTLLEISTTEGWVDVMYAAYDIDMSGPYIQPQRDSETHW